MILLALGAAYASSSFEQQIYERSTKSQSIFSDRSIYNIIWSCLATIFACTWISVHSNIPAPHDGPLRVLGRRMAIMAYLLIAPEMVIMWTTRQYLGASEISKRHRDKGWTKVHAFFLLMGGFSLYENGVLVRTLEALEFEKLVEEGKIDWPTITEEEIKDKSKGDPFSKGIVILQTSWFIVQCIVRGAKHLVLTELEVVTLAFAALTMSIYALWWHKPLDVQVSVPVHLKVPKMIETEEPETEDDVDISSRPADDLEAVGQEEQSQLLTNTNRHLDGTLSRTEEPGRDSPNEERPNSAGPVPKQRFRDPNLTPDVDISSRPADDLEAVGQEEQSQLLTNTDRHLDGTLSRTEEPGRDGPNEEKPNSAGPVPKQRFRDPNLTPWQNLRAYMRAKRKEHGLFFGIIYVFILRPGVIFFGPFVDMLSCTTLEDKRFRVPTFYSPAVADDSNSIVFAIFIALVFGGIHCIAWSFHFASWTERWVWRISAVLVSGLPVSISFLSVLMDTGGEDGYSSSLAKYFSDVLAFVLISSAILYIAARIALLILPIIALRALPPGAYVDINWTAYLPHI